MNGSRGLVRPYDTGSRGSWGCSGRRRCGGGRGSSELPLQALVGHIASQNTRQWVRPYIGGRGIVQHEGQVANCCAVHRFIQLGCHCSIDLRLALVETQGWSQQTQASFPATPTQDYGTPSGLLSEIQICVIVGRKGEQMVSDNLESWWLFFKLNCSSSCLGPSSTLIGESYDKSYCCFRWRACHPLKTFLAPAFAHSSFRLPLLDWISSARNEPC